MIAMHHINFRKADEVMGFHGWYASGLAPIPSN